jgi:AcrR family transcriptional regulator
METVANADQDQVSPVTAAGTGTARRRGRPPKSAASDTKAELMHAALNLFAAHGYEGTSVRAIARAVGLSESVLYAHFDSKRAIFEAVLAQLGPLSAIGLLETGDPGDPPAFIRSLVARGMDDWSSPQSRQLISLMAQDDLIHDPALVSSIGVAIGTLAGLFERWIEAGQVAAGLGSPMELAYALLSPIALARVLWLHTGANPGEMTAARDRAIRHAEFFIRAVFPDR